MSSRASTWFSLGSIGVAALALAVGCDGGDSTPGTPDGGPMRPDGSGLMEVSTLPPMARPDATTMIEARPPAVPPVVNAQAIKILPSGAQLLGGITVGCSYGPASTASGIRWCAFGLPGATLGQWELWVLNMSKAGAKCGGTGSADCIRLTDDLFGATPQAGPRFPTAHRFYGDTLIYHANETSTASQAYAGPIYAWQPGWPMPKKISSTNNAFRCVGHTRAPVALCLENVNATETEPLTFDLTGGKIDGAATVTKIAKILPSHPTEMDSSQWGAGFTPDGKYLLYSTGIAPVPPSTTPTPETLFYLETDKIGTETAKQVGESGLSEWTLSPDQTKWFYMRQYNYSPMAPSGTLYMADFPSGANEKRIAGGLIKAGANGGVAAYNMLAIKEGQLGFMAVVQNYIGGAGEYLVVKDPVAAAAGMTAAPNVLSLRTDIPNFPSNSPDLRYGWYFQAQSMTLQGITDSRILKNDGSGSCALTTTTTASVFGAPFLENAALTFWIDNYNADTDTGDGWLASPADCTTKKRKFGTGVDFWFIKGDEQMVYTDDVKDGATSVLKVAKVVNGDLGTPQPIQIQIERFFQLLPNQEGAIFQIKSGSSETVDGIYYYKLAGAAGGTDGGTADAAADAADASAGN